MLSNDGDFQSESHRLERPSCAQLQHIALKYKRVNFRLLDTYNTIP